MVVYRSHPCWPSSSKASCSVGQDWFSLGTLTSANGPFSGSACSTRYSIGILASPSDQARPADDSWGATLRGHGCQLHPPRSSMRADDSWWSALIPRKRMRAEVEERVQAVPVVALEVLDPGAVGVSG